MRQLKQEGWIHHLARHCVACFLTRGDLWQSWVKGAKVFDKLLIDADWSVNNANWMWLSASAFFRQYYRVYGPVSFPKTYILKSSSKGEKRGTFAFIRNCLPELKSIPDQYLLEPWKTPIEEQKKANCIIGKDYPKPIVDHETVKSRNLIRMKAAYSNNKTSKTK